jgi:hypothetical protein
MIYTENSPSPQLTGKLYLVSVHLETASFGPGRRFCDFAKASTAQAHFCNPRNSHTMPVEDPEIFSGWLQKRFPRTSSGNQNLLFPDGH